jgi:cell volume regulation protein A
MEAGTMILVAGALLATALGASLLAGRLRVPGLVAFLAIGMIVGSDGTGWIKFSDYELARTVGIIALSLILFEGGLASSIRELRPVMWPALSLAIVGTILTAVLTGLVAWWLFDFSALQAMLVGSIIAGTDGAAIFAVLRHSTLKRRLALTLEGEAGINDPVAVILVIGFVRWLQRDDYGIADMALLFVQELAIGAVFGAVVGGAATWALRHLRLGSAGLYPVASLAAAAIAYGSADAVHGSGFLAVYLCGLALGSADDIPARRTIVTFHEGLAWVGQLGMFLTLGLLVNPGQLGDVALEGTVVALVAAAVARPLAVALALPFGGFGMRDRVVLGWAGLRGAVPVVLATFPVIDGVARGVDFFNIVFFAVVLSTVLQGSTFEGFARLLGVTTDQQALPAPLLETGAVRRLGAEVAQFAVGPRDAVVGHAVRELGLPRDALLNLIVRGQQAIPPRGSTVIEAGDHLHVLVRQEAAVEFDVLLRRWRDGPIAQRPDRPVGTRGVSVFSTGPWGPDDGDPARPETVNGLRVIDRLRTRRDVPGALVALADGRFAYCGPIKAIGSARQLQDAARKRLGRAGGDVERAWWREVIGALEGERGTQG